VNISK